MCEAPTQDELIEQELDPLMREALLAVDPEEAEHFKVTKEAFQRVDIKKEYGVKRLREVVERNLEGDRASPMKSTPSWVHELVPTKHEGVWDQPVRGEELSGDLRRSSDTTHPTDDRHHAEPQVQLHPIPLRYIDVVRTRHTTLDVLQESRKDDYWNIDANRNLSDTWTGFTQFTTLNEQPPDGHVWFGERLAKIEADHKA